MEETIKFFLIWGLSVLLWMVTGLLCIAIGMPKGDDLN